MFYFFIFRWILNKNYRLICCSHYSIHDKSLEIRDAWMCVLAGLHGQEAGYFLTEWLWDKITPASFPQFYHIALYLNVAMEHSLQKVPPLFMAVPTERPQYSTETSEPAFSDKSICSNMEYSADRFSSWFLSICDEVFFWYKNWHLKESKQNCVVLWQRSPLAVPMQN